jgi:CheY-like chemotaxis protein
VFEAQNQRVDLMVTDVGLPSSMNGRQLADAARQLWPKLKNLVITGTKRSDRQRAPGAGDGDADEAVRDDGVWAQGARDI